MLRSMLVGQGPDATLWHFRRVQSKELFAPPYYTSALLSRRDCGLAIQTPDPGAVICRGCKGRPKNRGRDVAHDACDVCAITHWPDCQQYNLFKATRLADGHRTWTDRDMAT